VDALEKEREKLLRQVAKARAAFDDAEEITRDLTQAFVLRMEALHERLLGVVRDVLSQFEKLLGAESRLGKRDKAKVRQVRAGFVHGLPEELVALATEPNAADSLDTDGPEPAFRRESPGARGQKTRGNEEAGYSAPRPSADQAPTLRGLLRRLVGALHPDKVQDAAERARRTAVMKEVTRAYEAGDVAKLIELERSWLAATLPGDEPDALARKATALVATNAELRRQLRQLVARRKHFVRSAPFRVRRGDPDAAREAALRDIDDFVAGAEREVDDAFSVLAFVRRFANGDMAMGEFLAGRRAPDDRDDCPF
jgi:hypothetical protein